MDVMSLDVAIDAPPVTYAEYVASPETTQPVEVVDGRTIVNPNPANPHQYASARLAQILGAAAVASDLCVLVPSGDWVLRRDPLLVRQPDVVVVTREQARAPWLESPPVLAVEVLSPGSRERDLVAKRREYAEAGLGWYWLVALEAPQALVLRNDGGTFVEAASARGNGRLVVAEPFAVDLSPSDLAV